MAFIIKHKDKIKINELKNDAEFFQILLDSLEVNLEEDILLNRYQSVSEGKTKKKIAYFNDLKLIEVSFKKIGAEVLIFDNGNILFKLFYVDHEFYNIFSICYYYKGTLLVEDEYSIIPNQYQDLKRRKYFYHNQCFKETKYNFKEKPKTEIFYTPLENIDNNFGTFGFLYLLDASTDMAQTIQLLKKNQLGTADGISLNITNEEKNIFSVYGQTIEESLEAIKKIKEPYDLIEVPADVYEKLNDKSRFKKGEFSYQALVNLRNSHLLNGLVWENNTFSYQGSISALLIYALSVWGGSAGSAPGIIQESVRLNKKNLQIKRKISIKILFKGLSGKQGAKLVSEQVNGTDMIRIATKNQLYYLLRASLMINVLTAVIISASDLYKLIKRLISPKQAVKNIMKKLSTLLGAAFGASYGAIDSGFLHLPYEQQIGMIIFGVMGGFVAGVLTKLFLNWFITDDSETLISLLEDKLYEIGIGFLLNETEAKSSIRHFLDIEMIPTLQQMYKARNKQAFAYNLNMLLAMETIMKRKPVRI